VIRHEEQGLRIELFGDEVDGLASFDPLTGRRCASTTDRGLPEVDFVAPRSGLGAPSIDQGRAGVAARHPRLKGGCSKRSGCTSARCSTSR
jgi:excinuclease UvrABC helicase subunit UvrB